jgi:hypothetical protein
VIIGSWGHCIQMLLTGLLDHGAKHNPCMIWGRETVPFLKWPDVESGGKEETDGVGDELPIVYGLRPRSAVSAHSSILWKRTSGASVAK